MKRLSPALVLFLLSPAIGELLSSSSPPAEFFNPFTLVLLAGLYGSGAILARELVFRWGKGWPSLLALGAAYAIIEEGLAVKSFFDPAWVDLGDLGWYGRWLGVNWVWTIHLTLFHMLFSIAIPITLVTIWFPQRRHEAWVGRRMLIFFALLLLGVVVLCFFALTPYRPPLVGYLLAIAATAWLIRLARRFPAHLPERPGASTARPRRFLLIGFFSAFFGFFGVWLMPGLKIPALIGALLLCALAGFVLFRVLKLSGNGRLMEDRHRLALISGALGFLILLSPLVELSQPDRPDNVSGMTLVGLFFFGMLAITAWRLKGRERRLEWGQPTLAAP